MPSASSGSGVPARCGSTFVVYNLALSLLVLGYVILGGLLFHKLEAGHETQHRASVRSFRDECLRELWLITGALIIGMIARFLTSQLLNTYLRVQPVHLITPEYLDI